MSQCQIWGFKEYCAFSLISRFQFLHYFVTNQSIFPPGKEHITWLHRDMNFLLKSYFTILVKAASEISSTRKQECCISKFDLLYKHLMKYQTISLKHTFVWETRLVEIAMVIFFLYKDDMLFLCVNKSHEAYLGFHRCLQK